MHPAMYQMLANAQGRGREAPMQSPEFMQPNAAFNTFDPNANRDQFQLPPELQDGTKLNRMAAQSGMKAPMSAPKTAPSLGAAARAVTGEDNPISRGVASALETTRASSQMSEDQQRRAMGKALVAWAANFSGGNNPTALGRAAEAMLPGLNAYNQEENAAQNLNLQALNRQDALENQAWNRNLALQQFELAKMAEARLASGAGSLKPGNKIQLRTALSSAQSAMNAARDSKTREWVNNLDPQLRTIEALEEIKRRVEDDLTPYKQTIDGILAQAAELGYDLSNPYDTTQNPALNSGAAALKNMSNEELINAYHGAK